MFKNKKYEITGIMYPAPHYPRLLHRWQNVDTEENVLNPLTSQNPVLEERNLE